MKHTGWTTQQRMYFKDVRRSLRCSSKLRRQILAGLQSAIEDSPEASRAELESRFGTPSQFAQNVQSGMEPEQLAQARIQPFKYSLIVLAALLLLGIAGAGFYTSRELDLPKEAFGSETQAVPASAEKIEQFSLLLEDFLEDLKEANPS